ncbi:SGNH/GDSL hydrolase family protein [Kocuria rosea]|uniref:SGNH/GDSL hydrolase family protein n=1 Tax=Kocuria rosea TaxID=1275 RepID=UPI000F6E662F|nr:SGNH/GDSL hydrolase family protein [Kocuria rosea]VEI50353.1 GDSL-like Lipase/Acylhydrolase [Kocuria rosea]
MNLFTPRPRAGHEPPWRTSRGRRKLADGAIIAMCLLIPGVVWAASTDYFGPDAHQPRPVVAPSLQREHISIIGDSFTGGSDEGGNGRANWTEQIRPLLRDDSHITGLTVVGLGGSGYVSKAFTGRAFKDAVEESVTEDSDVVLIFGSINDRNYAGQVASAARDVYERVEELAPEAQLIVVGPQIPYAEPTEQDIGLAEEVRSAAEGHADFFVDPIADDWFDDERVIGADGNHPTDEGHKLMAERMAPVLRVALDARHASESPRSGE